MFSLHKLTFNLHNRYEKQTGQVLAPFDTQGTQYPEKLTVFVKDKSLLKTTLKWVKELGEELRSSVAMRNISLSNTSRVARKVLGLSQSRHRWRHTFNSMEGLGDVEKFLCSFSTQSVSSSVPTLPD